MTGLLHDLRDSWRGLRRDRLYAGAVIATLALTLGATTAVFSIVNGVLLRPLSYPQSQALVSIREVIPGPDQRYPSLPVTPRHFEIWRHRATSFSAMAQMDWRTSTLTGAGDPSQVVMLRASGTIFDVLQMPIALGRPLSWDDENLDRPRVAVVTDRLWRERLGGDPATLGRALTLGGVQYTIVGVTAPGAAFPNLASLAEGGTVTRDVAAIVPFRITLSNFDWMGQFNYGVVARLKPGVTLAQARAEMDVLQGAVAQIASRETREPVALRALVTPLADTIVGPIRRGLLLLLGAIAGVLLIACANLANLTLTRTLERMRDTAVRGALGAGRWRLMRAVFVDQAALAMTGGAFGLLVAAWALRVFVANAPAGLPRAQDVTMDPSVIAFAAAIALAAALAVGVLPAFRVGRASLESMLRSGGRASDRGGQRARSALLAAQVALSVTLLAVSGLFLSSLDRLLRVETGFSAAGAITVEVAPVSTRYPDVAARAALYDRIGTSVRGLPGVTSAAWTSALPLTGETWVDKIVRPDARDTVQSPANYRFVGPEYFRAMGMPLLQGRSFEPADRTRATTPAVISARSANALWPGESAVGRIFERGNPDQRFEVVGVVADGHVTSLPAEPPAMVYVPYWFNNEGKSILVVRGSVEASALVVQVREAVRATDPDVAIARVAPLQRVVDAAVEAPRYQAALLLAFAGIALMIAVIGVYATTAYGVSQRRREMNIRFALGAQARQVFGLVVRQSIGPLAAGLLAGVGGAAIAGSLVASLLYQVPARDPMILAAVAALVLVVGTASVLIATRHTLDPDPAGALRAD